MKKLLFHYAILIVFTSTAQENLFIIKLGNLYGIVDSDGTEVVQPKYHHISHFGVTKENWAKVELNGKYGFIDKTGKVIVEPIYTSISKFNEYRKGWAKVSIKIINMDLSIQMVK